MTESAAAQEALGSDTMDRSESGEAPRLEGSSSSTLRQPDAPAADPALIGLELAMQFHDLYESMAPQFGYETRLETRKFDPESNNGRLMIAVCAEIKRLTK